jgi:DNA-binding CsgD family transcriptional regulator
MGRRVRPAAGASLTGTEFSVAELVSEGLTNREVGDRLFISQNTVAFHLKKVFRKLNISSRAELVRAWSDGGRVLTGSMDGVSRAYRLPRTGGFSNPARTK